MKLFQDRPGLDPIFDNALIKHYLPLLSGPAWNLLAFMFMGAKDFYTGAQNPWYTLRELQQAGGWGNPAVRSTNSVISGMRHLLAHSLALKSHCFEQKDIGTPNAPRKAPVGVAFKKQKIMYRLNPPPEFEKMFRPGLKEGYTPFPYLMVREIRPVVSDLTWKIITVFTRYTWGFNRGEKPAGISYASLREMTGIKDNQTISKALDEIAFFMGQGLFHLDLKGYNDRMIRLTVNHDFYLIDPKTTDNQAREKSEIYPQSYPQAREKSEIYPQNGFNNHYSSAREIADLSPSARKIGDIAREKSEIESYSARKIGDSDPIAREKSTHVNTDSLNTDLSLNKEKEIQQQQAVVFEKPLSQQLSDLSQLKHEALKQLGITNKYGNILDKLTANETVTLDMVNEAIDHKARFKKQTGLYVKFLKGEMTLNWEDSPQNGTTPKLTTVANDPTPPWEEHPANEPIWEAAKEILAGEWDGGTMSHLYGAKCERAGGNFTLYTSWLSQETLNRMKKYIHKAIERAAGGVVSLKIEVRR